MKSAKDYFMEDRELELVPFRQPAALSKKQITAQAKEFAASLLESNDPVSLMVDVKRLEEYILAMKAVISQATIAENPDGIINGAKVEVMGARNTFTYDHCARWQELSKALKEYEGLMKKAAETPGFEIIDTVTGEAVTPAVHKLGTPFLKITL